MLNKRPFYCFFFHFPYIYNQPKESFKCFDKNFERSQARGSFLEGLLRCHFCGLSHCPAEQGLRMFKASENGLYPLGGLAATKLIIKTWV